MDRNTGACRNLGVDFVPRMRLLDKGGFISDPGFERCKNAGRVCVWKKVG
ncbi:hypothetical protein [Streptomyces anandii]